MEDFRMLVSLASRIIHDCQVTLNRTLMDLGLGSAEANVLMFLYSGGDGVRQDDIVAATEVSKPAISRTVASLEAKGYVVREQALSDKRSRIVRLTEKAKAIQAVVEQHYSDLVSAAARDIPADRIHEFMAMFSQVARNVARYREDVLGVRCSRTILDNGDIRSTTPRPERSQRTRNGQLDNKRNNREGKSR
ncbi:MAG: MarR family winged helix-turn-helix transcriptional regulator [Bacillota bacterium]|nr:winged helix-turn-helix transcriptional regulator [Candidatus Fermentithermobacillaceae bacterium]